MCYWTNTNTWAYLFILVYWWLGNNREYTVVYIRRENFHMKLKSSASTEVNTKLLIFLFLKAKQSFHFVLYSNAPNSLLKECCIGESFLLYYFVMKNNKVSIINWPFLSYWELFLVLKHKLTRLFWKNTFNPHKSN